MRTNPGHDQAAFTLRPVGAFLDGNDSDLEALAELTTGGEHYVEQAIIDGELRWVLRGPRNEYLWHDPGEMHRPAGWSSGSMASRTRSAGTSATYGTSFATAVRGTRPQWTSIGCAIEIDTAFGVGPAAPPPPPPGPAYFAALDRNPVVGQVLDLMGQDDELSSYSMWKILELIRRDVTGMENPGAARQEFVRQDWLTDDEYKDFGGVLNDQNRSGDQARHATHAPTTGTMTLRDARVLLARIVRTWRATL